jgi:hypothetical protein
VRRNVPSYPKAGCRTTNLHLPHLPLPFFNFFIEDVRSINSHLSIYTTAFPHHAEAQLPPESRSRSRSIAFAQLSSLATPIKPPGPPNDPQMTLIPLQNHLRNEPNPPPYLPHPLLHCLKTSNHFSPGSRNPYTMRTLTTLSSASR